MSTPSTTTAHETIDYAQWERIRLALSPCVPTGKRTEPAFKSRANWDHACAGLDALPTVDHKARAAERVADYRPMRDDPLKRGGSLLPYPVYVARFADGSTSRLSFWSAAKKPINFARGYNVSLLIHERKPLAGYVEWNGTQLPDPFFQPADAAAVSGAPVKRRASSRDYQRMLAEIAELLAAGEIEAARAVCAG